MWFKSSDKRLIDVSSCSLQLMADPNGKWGDQAIMLSGPFQRALFTDRHIRRHNTAIVTEITMADVWLALEQLLQEGLNIVAENDEQVLDRAQAIVDASTVKTNSSSVANAPPDTFSMVIHTTYGPVRGTFLADPLVDAKTEPGEGDS